MFGGEETNYGDICIYNNCNTIDRSSCRLGKTYSLPNGMIYSSNEANTYLAGTSKFLVNEIEVYGVHSQ
jgi:hypothetical protein